MIKLSKGQITMSWLLGIAATVLLASYGSMTASNVRTDDKVQTVQTEVNQTKVDIGKLQAQGPDIDRRLTNIETKIDLLLERK